MTSCGPAKISKILIVRKSIARVLTVHNQLAKSKVISYDSLSPGINITMSTSLPTDERMLYFEFQLREKVVGTKFIPIELRAKTTRAMRRRLTPEQVF